MLRFLRVEGNSTKVLHGPREQRSSYPFARRGFQDFCCVLNCDWVKTDLFMMRVGVFHLPILTFIYYCKKVGFVVGQRVITECVSKLVKSLKGKKTVCFFRKALFLLLSLVWPPSIHGCPLTLVMATSDLPTMRSGYSTSGFDSRCGSTW